MCQNPPFRYDYALNEALIDVQERLAQYTGMVVGGRVHLQLHFVAAIVHCFSLVSGLPEQELASMAGLCWRRVAGNGSEYVRV